MPTIGRGRVTAGTGEVTFRPGDEAASEQDGVLPSGAGNEPSLADVGATQSIYVRSITGNNLGAGAVIFRGSNGQLDVVLDFKSLVAGDGVEFEDSANELRISATGGGTGGLPDIAELVPGSYDYASIVVDQKGRIRFARSNVAGDVSNAQNLGFGSPLYVNKQVGVLRFRSLRGDVGSGVSTSVVGDEVVIGVTGVVRNLAVVPSNGITITGSPVTGSGTLVVGLADTTVAPGTYSTANIVVDRFGRITTASNGSLNARLTVAQNGVVVGDFERLDVVGAAVSEPVSGTARITITTPTINGLANRPGSGAAVFSGINAGTGEFRRITGSGVATVVEAADEIRITVPPPPTPTVTGLSNLAAGQGQVFESITAGVGGFRRITGVGGISVTTSGTDVVVDGSGVQPPASRVGVASEGGVLGSYSTLLVRGNATINNIPPGPTNTGTVAIEVPFGIGSISNLGTSGSNIGFLYEGVTGSGQQTARFRRLIATGGITLAQNATDLVLSGAAFLTAVPPSGVTPGTYNLTNLVVGADGRIISAQNGSLAPSGVTAGTYTLATIAVDDRGRVISAQSGDAITSIINLGNQNPYAAQADIGLFYSLEFGQAGFRSLRAGSGIDLSSEQDRVNIALGTSGVTAGTYALSNIVVDQFGRVTSASNGSASGNGITSLTVTGAGEIAVAGSPLTSAGTIGLSLAPSGVAPGTYTRVTVDAKGRVTAGGNATFVSSVAITAGAGVAVSGGPITTSGTLTVGLANTGVSAGTYSLATVTVDPQGRITAAASGVVPSQPIAFSGDATGSGATTGTVALTLANSGVTAGTYALATVAVDGKGRVVSAASGTAVTSVALAAGGGVTLAGGPITGSGTITVGLATLAASGTYSLANIVVDQFGRVTSASDGSASGNGITSLSLAGAEFSFSPAALTSAGTISLALAPTGVVAGTYSFATVAVDAKGRVTSVASTSLPPAVTRVVVNGSDDVEVFGDTTITGQGTFNIRLRDNFGAPGQYNSVFVGSTGLVTEATNIPYLQTAVTSVAIAAGAGIVASGGPVTTVGTLNVALATSGVTAGSYALANITVDQFGRITSAASGSATGNGITSLTLAGADFTFSGSPLTSAGTIEFGLASVGTAGTYTSVVTDAKGRVVSGTNPGFITGNQTITLSGDATGSGATAIALTLANVGTAGTYNSVITDAKGRVTAGSLVPYLLGNQTITLSGDVTGSGATSISAVLANSGVTAGVYSFATVTVDAKGRVTLAAAGTPVTNVALAGGSGIAVAGGPVTSSGTFTVSLAPAGPATGTFAFATVQTDANGRIVSAAQGTAVTSVALAAGSGVTIAGSPITTAGTITVGLGTSGVAAGSYAFSSVTVDQFGRITSATAGSPVTSVALSGSEFSFAGSPITSDGTIGVALATTGVAAGTYSSVVVDTKGRVTAGTNPGFLTAESDTLASVVSRGANTTATLTVGGIIGNASTATALQTSRVVAVSGDATGSANFDGSANATIPVTLANSGVTAGTYSFATVAVDAKGRVTFAASGSPAGGPSLTTGTYDVARVTVDGSGQISAVAATTVTNRGSAAPIMVQSAGTLAFKTIRAGSNVTVTESANEVTIAASSGGGASAVDVYTFRVNYSGVSGTANVVSVEDLPAGWTITQPHTVSGNISTLNTPAQSFGITIATPYPAGRWPLFSAHGIRSDGNYNHRVAATGAPWEVVVFSGRNGFQFNSITTAGTGAMTTGSLPSGVTVNHAFVRVII